MKRFLQSLAMFLRRTSWTAPPDWNEAEARALASFLGSPAGAKLRVILQSEIASANERAAMSKGAAFECGWACGYRGLYAWFESLSAPSAPEPDSADHDLENLIP
jgi:hypothetical protein